MPLQCLRKLLAGRQVNEPVADVDGNAGESALRLRLAPFGIRQHPVKQMWKHRIHRSTHRAIMCGHVGSNRTTPGEEQDMTTYNPAAQFDIKVWDVEFRKTPSRMLMARIYQPQGAGPFP